MQVACVRPERGPGEELPPLASQGPGSQHVAAASLNSALVLDPERAEDEDLLDRRHEGRDPAGGAIKRGPDELWPNQPVTIGQIFIRDPWRGDQRLGRNPPGKDPQPVTIGTAWTANKAFGKRMAIEAAEVHAGVNCLVEAQEPG